MNARDEAEFAEFVVSASPRLLHTAWLLTGDQAVAEEIVQEALARMYRRWRRVRTGYPVAYARRIMMNLVTDRARRQAHESVTRSGFVPEVPASDGVETVDQRDLAIRLLETLPVREREVVVLRHYVDLSEREVAALLGISVGTVKSSNSHGLATLRATLPREGAQ